MLNIHIQEAPDGYQVHCDTADLSVSTATFRDPNEALGALRYELNQKLWADYEAQGELTPERRHVIHHWLAGFVGFDVEEGEDFIVDGWIEQNRWEDKKLRYAALARRRFPKLLEAIATDPADIKWNHLLSFGEEAHTDILYHNLPSWDWDEPRKYWEAFEAIAFESLDGAGPAAVPWILFCDAILESYGDISRGKKQAQWEKWGFLPADWQAMLDQAIADGREADAIRQIEDRAYGICSRCLYRPKTCQPIPCTVRTYGPPDSRSCPDYKQCD